MKPFNLSSFKKVAEDKHSATMLHKDGHTIKIAKANLPKLEIKRLEKLPLHMASGGQPYAQAMSEGAAPAEDQAPSVPPSIAAPEQVAQTDLPPAPANQMSSINTTIPAAMSQPSVNPNDLNNMSYQGVANQYGAIQNQMAKTQGQAGNVRADLEVQRQKDLADAQAQSEQQNKFMNQDIDSAVQDMKNGRIDPNHYLASKNDDQKSNLLIGAFLGGWGSAYTHQGNTALNLINDQIGRDIDAQKANQDTKKSVYHAYLDKYKDAQAADIMARATQTQLYASKMQEAADRIVDPMARQQAQLNTLQFKQQMLPMVANANLLSQAAPFRGGAGSSPGSEGQFQNVLNGAAQLNPEMHKDLSSKYIPGLGVAAVAVKPEDSEGLYAMRDMNSLANELKALSFDKNITVPGSAENQKALYLQHQAALAMQKLSGVNRLNEQELKMFNEMIANPGQMNQAQARQSFENFSNEIQHKAQSISDRIGLRAFAPPGSQRQTPQQMPSISPMEIGSKINHSLALKMPGQK